MLYDLIQDFRDDDFTYGFSSDLIRSDMIRCTILARSYHPIFRPGLFSRINKPNIVNTKSYVTKYLISWVRVILSVASDMKRIAEFLSGGFSNILVVSKETQSRLK